MEGNWSLFQSLSTLPQMVQKVERKIGGGGENEMGKHDLAWLVHGVPCHIFFFFLYRSFIFHLLVSCILIYYIDSYYLNFFYMVI